MNLEIPSGRGWQDGSAGEATHKDWWPEFGPQDSHGGRRGEQTL